MEAFKDLPESKEFPVSESAEVLTLALSHMYAQCDPLPITMLNAPELVDFFRKYDVPKGIPACDSALSASAEFTPGNLRDWILLADQHKLPRLLEKCLKHSSRHMSQQYKPKRWLAQLQPTTLATLVSWHHTLGICAHSSAS